MIYFFSNDLEITLCLLYILLILACCYLYSSYARSRLSIPILDRQKRCFYGKNLMYKKIAVVRLQIVYNKYRKNTITRIKEIFIIPIIF
jgi:hypothetical protein